MEEKPDQASWNGHECHAGRRSIRRTRRVCGQRPRRRQTASDQEQAGRRALVG